MKKNLLLLALLCGAFALTAQNTVNNGGFENWTSGSAVTQQPTGWTTGLIGNIMVDFLGQQVPIPINTYFGSKSTDAHSGTAALQLNPDSIGISMLGIGYPFPAIAQLGSASGFNIPLSTIMSVVDLIGTISSGDTSGLNFDDIDFESLASLMQVMAPGDQLTQTPGHLNMYAKFHPEEGEAMYVIAFSKMGGIPVGIAYYTTQETFDEYTLVSVPFDSPLVPCDSINIIIGCGGVASHKTTELLVDDLTFDFVPDGVNSYERPVFSVSPNPAAGQFFINPEENAPYAYQMFDLQGRIIREENNCDGVASVNTNNLPKGVYVLKINQNGQSFPQKVVVR